MLRLLLLRGSISPATLLHRTLGITGRLLKNADSGLNTIPLRGCTSASENTMWWHSSGSVRRIPSWHCCESITEATDAQSRRQVSRIGACREGVGHGESESEPRRLAKEHRGAWSSREFAGSILSADGSYRPLARALSGSRRPFRCRSGGAAPAIYEYDAPGKPVIASRNV